MNIVIIGLLSILAGFGAGVIIQDITKAFSKKEKDDDILDNF